MLLFFSVSKTFKVSLLIIRAKVYEVGDRVLWLDKKTRRGRCTKLNRTWTGPWVVIKEFK